MSLRRSVWLLAAVVLVQLFFLSRQLSGPGRPPSLLHRAAVGAVAPFASAVDLTGGLVEGVGRGLQTRSRAQAENVALREENARLRREAVQRLEAERDLVRLREALEYERAWGGGVRVADVVYVDHAAWLQSALVWVGEAGAEPSQPVVAGEALLGRVVLVVGGYAKVQLLTDRASSVGVMVERTRRQGIVRGAGRDGLRLEFVPSRADLVVGDHLVTAGIDGVYPRGIPVGMVRSVEPGTDLFYRVEVDPVVDFGRLEQVLLLTTPAVPPEARTAAPDASLEETP